MARAGRERAAFRALWWKEWRQLRLLRLAGAVLCLLLPAMLLAGAAAARRGWLPFGGASSYTVRDVLVDAVPPVMIAAWGLLALFVIAQSFLGDRAAGTELFLLTSPVRRRWVWRVRIAACIASIAVIVVAGIVIWSSCAFASSGPSAVLESGKLALLVGSGAAVLLIGLLSGLGAVALVPSPLPAVLAGLVLGFLPIGLDAVIAITFPFARWHGVSLGNLALLLFPVYGIVSFRALCTGEPAGRGRYRRAGVTLGGAVVAVVLLFLSLAPLTAHAVSIRDGLPHPSPTEPLALIVSNWPVRRGWLVDTSTGELRHEFGQSAVQDWWSPDGRYLAVISEAGPLGMRLPSPKVVIYDTTRMQVVRSVSAHELGLAVPTTAGWAAGHLVLGGFDAEARPRLGTVRWADWVAEPLVLDPALLDAAPWTLVGPGADGRLYLAMAERSRLRLHLLDVEARSIAREPRARVAGGSAVGSRGLLEAGLLSWRLAPSGRYWIESEPGKSRNLEVQDLDSGSVHELACDKLGRVRWLVGDTLVWGDYGETRSRLRSWSPATHEQELLTTGAGLRFNLEPSPDGRKLLLIELNPGKGFVRGSARVWNATTGSWFEADLQGSWLTGGWAGPDVLAGWGPEGLTYRPLQ